MCAIKIDGIEEDFEFVYENGDVQDEGSYHQPDINDMNPCGCDLTTGKGAYREVKVLYDGMMYGFYHQTPIVVELSDTKYIVNNGGYKTSSTKQKISRWLPSGVSVIQRSHDWYIDFDDNREEYRNGVLVDTRNEEVRYIDNISEVTMMN